MVRCSFTLFISVPWRCRVPKHCRGYGYIFGSQIRQEKEKAGERDPIFQFVSFVYLFTLQSLQHLVNCHQHFYNTYLTTAQCPRSPMRYHPQPLLNTHPLLPPGPPGKRVSLTHILPVIFQLTCSRNPQCIAWRPSTRPSLCRRGIFYLGLEERKRTLNRE